MADEKLVFDLAFGRVDVSGITKALTSEMGKVFSTTKSALGASGEAVSGGAKGGGDIAAALQMVLGPMIEDFAKLVQTTIMLLGPILIIATVVKILADIIGAFWNAFRNVTKVWSAILTLISKLVEPFVNLLIPLMIPVLQLLGIMARLVNTLLMPIFTLLMKAFTPGGNVLQTAMKQILGGDVLGGIMTILTAVGQQFLKVKDQLVQQLMPVLEMVKNVFLSFLTLDLNKIHDVVNNLFGKDLGNVINGLIDAIYFAISAVIGFASQLAGKGNFDKIFGTGQFDKIKESNKGFGAGVDIASKVQDVWNVLTDLAGRVGEFITTHWGNLVKVVADLVDNILPKLGKTVGDFIDNQWANWSNFIQTQIIPVLGSLYSDINEFRWTQLTNLKTAVSTLSNAINSWSKIDFKSILNDAAKAAANAMSLGQAENIGKMFSSEQQDFVFRPGQGVAAFSPQDTIIGVKDASALGGKGGTINNHYYINGNGDQFLENKIKDVIRQNESTQSRYGYYQKGY